MPKHGAAGPSIYIHGVLDGKLQHGCFLVYTDNRNVPKNNSQLVFFSGDCRDIMVFSWCISASCQYYFVTHVCAALRLEHTFNKS